MSENDGHFLKRFYIYQKERFPFLSHGILIAVFTFSAISYSRICRGLDSFIDPVDYIIGVLITLTFFLLIRLFDEFKDEEEDAQFRTYLPVPRGLISLRELFWVAIVVVLFQLAILLTFFPSMLYLYMICMAYLFLMRVEFFIPTWLKKHQIAYITSHMVIIPLVDIFASGLDWLLDGSRPHYGLLYFFAVSFMNGIVLEFGRKIRTPDSEEEGVLSYTRLYGTKGSVIAWMGILLVTLTAALLASIYANHGSGSIVVLIVCFIVCSIPAALFLIKPTVKKSKWIEHASGIWTIGMYLILGGIPMLKSLIG